MYTFLISYDLWWPEAIGDYEIISNRIKQNFNYIKPLESFRLIKSTLNECEIRDKIGWFMDRNDKLVVMNVTWDMRASRWLKQSESDWMQTI